MGSRGDPGRLKDLTKVCKLVGDTGFQASSLCVHLWVRVCIHCNISMVCEFYISDEQSGGVALSDGCEHIACGAVHLLAGPAVVPAGTRGQTRL